MTLQEERQSNAIIRISQELTKLRKAQGLVSFSSTHGTIYHIPRHRITGLLDYGNYYYVGIDANNEMIPVDRQTFNMLFETLQDN